MDSPSCGSGDRLEVRAAGVDKVREHVRPVIPLVPRDLRGRVDLDWHHLANGAALDQHDRRADPACAPAALLAPLDVCRDERVARRDVCAGDDMRALDGESGDTVNMWGGEEGGKGETYCLWASLEGRGVSSTRSADWRTLEGTRLSWRAWKPAQPRRVACWEVKRRSSFATFSSG